VVEQKPYDGHWAEIILHADKSGIFQGIEINPSLNAEVIEKDLWVSPGDAVRGFEGANDAIGTLVLKFDDSEVLESTISRINKYIKIHVC
jgi:hypothetical protein